jgi:hypothetical protein
LLDIYERKHGRISLIEDVQDKKRSWIERQQLLSSSSESNYSNMNPSSCVRGKLLLGKPNAVISIILDKVKVAFSTESKLAIAYEAMVLFQRFGIAQPHLVIVPPCTT